MMGKGACAGDKSGVAREPRERLNSRADLYIRYAGSELFASLCAMQFSSRDGACEWIDELSTETLVEAIVTSADAPAERVSDAS